MHTYIGWVDQFSWVSIEFNLDQVKLAKLVNASKKLSKPNAVFIDPNLTVRRGSVIVITQPNWAAEMYVHEDWANIGAFSTLVALLWECIGCSPPANNLSVSKMAKLLSVW
jgi:hypothetical protein